MKGSTICALFAIGASIAATPTLSTVYADAYPQDAERSNALAQCFAADHGFDRLLASERAACYARFMPAAPVAAAPAYHPHLAAVNFVDLREAAGRGHQPVNDVITQQQNAAALRQIRDSIE